MPDHSPLLTELFGNTPVLAHDSTQVSEAEAAQLAVRKMEASDALGLAQCIYRCYGPSYPNPMMYQPQLIAAALRDSSMFSIVALTPQGEVVGHCALSFEDTTDPIPEAAKLVVDPRYRGHHISDRIAKVRQGYAQELGIAGYWAACVSNHPFSQDEVISSGGGEMGLLINGQPGDVQMAGLSNVSGVRHSLLPFYISIQSKPTPDTLPNQASEQNPQVYLPSYHHAFFTSLMKPLNLQRTVISTASAVKTKKTSQLSTAIAHLGAPAHLRIAVLGDDLVQQLAKEVEKLQPLAPPVIYLDIPLHNPLAAQEIETLEQLGFFWAAWLPNFERGGDVLRLQRLQDQRVNEQDIICARKAGEAVRDHVLAEWQRVQKNVQIINAASK